MGIYHALSSVTRLMNYKLFTAITFNVTILFTMSFDGPATVRSLLSVHTFVKTSNPFLFYQIAAFKSVIGIDSNYIMVNVCGVFPHTFEYNGTLQTDDYLPFLRGLRGAVETPAAASICGVTPAEVTAEPSPTDTESLLAETPTLAARALARQFSHHNINGLAMYIEEYVPMIMPMNKHQEKLRNTSPPKASIATTVRNVNPEVIIVRESV